MGLFDFIKASIHKVTAPPDARTLSPGRQTRNRPPRRTRNRPPRSYPRRDPLRKLTKIMEGNYHQLIAKLRPVSSIDEGIEKLDEMLDTPVHPNHSRNFFTHPFVVNALDLNHSPKSVNESQEENWWEVDKSVGKSAIPKSSFPISENVDVCGEPSCSTGVNAFDFRCFSCRKRYCDVHKNTGIDCKFCET